jgi:two-component system, OmpR family, sensor kinase
VLRSLSLRARLVIGLIVLSAVGLVAAGTVTYTSVRSFLFDRTDQSLQDSSFGAQRALIGPGCGGQSRRPLPGTSPGDFVQLRTAAGEVICSLQIADFSGSAVSPPALPADIATPPDGDDPERASYFTVDARDGGGRYRVRAATALGTNATVVVATSLRDVEATLNRLLLIEVLVTGAVLVALGALALWVVRLGLRPLTAIGGTAAAIAAGDLSRRVERAEPRTEVGRLGLALNAMLGKIESAFEAQAASERKLRRFVADASHELRTPLAAVRAYAELFERGADRRPDDLARSMEGIERESERMSSLVDDLLLLARLDEGRPLAQEQVELEEVVREAVETARTVEPDRPIELEAAHATVVGDRERLRQIVDNLLANTREHTPAGTPVHVRLATSNGRAVVEVEDSGPGLSPKDEERIFERFYRADESRSRASGGVGLGLAIVAAVAEAHCGSVTARSEPARGAAFAITLPLATTVRMAP